MKNIFFPILLVFIFSTFVISQSFLDWTAYSSFRTVSGIAEDNENRQWVITDGGIIVYDGDKVVQTLTQIDGLARLDASVLTYSSEFDIIFVGYLTGTIDVVNTNDFSIESLTDIERNVSFSQKGIYDFEIIGQSLFVATDFGLVEFNIEELFVKDSHLKFGSFTSGIPVYDIVVNNEMLFLGTAEGIAFTSVDGNYSSNEWNNYDNSNGYVSSATYSLTVFENTIYASTISENYKFENDNWTINNDFSNEIIVDYFSDQTILAALSERTIYYKQTGETFSNLSLSNSLGTIISENSGADALLIGTRNNGLAEIDISTEELEYRVADGPYVNFFEGMSFTDGVLISGSTRSSSGRGDIDRSRGFYIFEDNNWENYNELITPEFQGLIYRQTFKTTFTEKYYYFGSWGTGVVRFDKETDEIRLFDETNSTLRGWPQDSELFPVISGLQTDSNDDVWLVSRYGGTPLYRQTPGDEDWQSFEESSAINNSDLYENLFVDSFDQKWVPLQNAQTTGTGLLIIDTKDPENENDDIGVKLQTGSSNGNLPDNKVNALIEDSNGEVWIGTARGIARFIFPELIVDGSVSERTAQWLINEDTSAVSRFLLRDVNATAMAVNAANQKWIGSANQGVWLLNAEGSKILKRFTKDNSPLFSNSINSIAINDETGEVFIATDVGLISYQDVPKKPVAKMNDLKVFPNPFNYSNNDQIFIEGLSDEANIKVLGVDGTVVNSFETIGGRTTWDGKNSNGKELGSGVYFIVAVDAQGNSKGVGKVVIVQ